MVGICYGRLFQPLVFKLVLATVKRPDNMWAIEDLGECHDCDAIDLAMWFSVTSLIDVIF